MVSRPILLAIGFELIVLGVVGQMNSTALNRWINAAFRKHGACMPPSSLCCATLLSVTSDVPGKTGLSLRGEAGQAIKERFGDQLSVTDKKVVDAMLEAIVNQIKQKRTTGAGSFVELDAVCGTGKGWLQGKPSIRVIHLSPFR